MPKPVVLTKMCELHVIDMQAGSSGSRMFPRRALQRPCPVTQVGMPVADTFRNI